MTTDLPDWLVGRGGELKRGLRENNWLVVLGGRPQYRVDLKPARGAFTYSIVQTVNGREFTSDRTFPTPEEALRSGLEHLRENLGW